jgi:transcription elongation factor Elf1
MKSSGYPSNWTSIARKVKQAAGFKCVRCGHVDDKETGYMLTVHHLDGNKGNCRWWNLVALCQRCHLSIQGRVKMDQPFIFEHSEWFKPYVAGYYAWKYLKKNLGRMRVLERLDDLLALERVL